MHWSFINRMCQQWREKTWRPWGAQCPYNMHHAETRSQLDFIKHSLFRRYCSNHPRPFKRGQKQTGLRGGSLYKHNKLYRFYWRLHGESKPTNREG
jgi:hypothetical protein